MARARVQRQEFNATTDQVSTNLGFSVRTIQRMAQHGELPAIKVNGRWMIDRVYAFGSPVNSSRVQALLGAHS